MAIASSVDVLNGGGGPAIQAESRSIAVYGTIVLTGNYSTGGDTWDFTAMTLPPGWTLPGFGLPQYVWVWEQTSAGNGNGGNSGFTYAWRPGNALNNQKLQIFQSANSEFAAGAYSAALLAATIKFCAIFSMPS